MRLPLRAGFGQHGERAAPLAAHRPFDLHEFPQSCPSRVISRSARDCMCLYHTGWAEYGPVLAQFRERLSK
jgi:hypothetical protein